MNRIIFALLLALSFLSFVFQSYKLVMAFALIKVLLLLFFYMELRHAHWAWKIIMTGLLLVIFGGVFLH